MSDKVLLLIEATGIQDYVFGSNQLLQNIGASELVQQATTEWVYERLPTPNNVRRVVDQLTQSDSWEITDQGTLNDGLAAEVVYAGGGNAMILFGNSKDLASVAESFTKDLTKEVLLRAPGLNLVVSWQHLDSRPLREVHQTLRKHLALKKLNRPANVPLLGLSVTAACKFTGAPAIALDKERRLISAEVQAKRNAKDKAEHRLHEYLSDVPQDEYEFLTDFDKMGTKGESSYLAIVHTDGNGMGNRVKGISDSCGDRDDEYVRALREFSKSVNVAAKRALTRTVGMLLAPNNLAQIEDGEDSTEYRIGKTVPVPHGEENRLVLPFRPIVFGGDDVTFVCEGRLGLELAAKYLYEYSRESLSDGKPAYARAGVAVVKSHYPFSRGYALAEDLCRSAKKYIKGLSTPSTSDYNALDWHFAVNGLVVPLDQIRKREYVSASGHSLLMRPIHLGAPEDKWRSWQTFIGLMEDFLGGTESESRHGEWRERRNKLKALRDVLRDGPESVKLFLRTIDAKLPKISQAAEMELQGWQGEECGYFDAIEALDFFVMLDGGVE